jgi:hypothetical protein
MAAGGGTGAVAGFLSKTSFIVLEEAKRFPSFACSSLRQPPPISPGVQNIMSSEVEGRDGVSATWGTTKCRDACGCEAHAAVSQHEGVGGPTEAPANELHIWIQKAEVPSKRQVNYH